MSITCLESGVGWKVRGKSNFLRACVYLIVWQKGREWRLLSAMTRKSRKERQPPLPQGMESDLRDERDYRNYFHEKPLRYRNTSRAVHVSRDKA